MAKQTRKLLLCDCLGSQSVDAARISAGCGMSCSKPGTALCTDEIGKVAEAMAQGDVVVACGQEAARFEELAAEIGLEAPACVDIRDRAGWTDNGDPTAKQAALLTEAMMPARPGKAVDVISEGLCLIMGPADTALGAAEALCDALSVTVLVTDGTLPDVPDRRFDVIIGDLKQARGALGGFELRIDGLQQMEPGGRGAPRMTEPRNAARSECDILLDLTGGTPLFPAHEKREGYLRPDPGSQSAVQSALLEAVQLVGTFEKPLYVAFEESLCAHSRAEQPACSRCLNVCPTGAITSAGDHVAIDPMICAGCGACSALCPSGAISYDAPPVDQVFRRMETLARVYRETGGGVPRLLVHDAEYGGEMIRLAARFGRGLPVDVIPLEVAVLSGFGHAEMVAALGVGFGAVDVLLAPKADRDVLEHELALGMALGGAGKLRLLDVNDPDAMSEALYEAAAVQTAADPILPMGSRRQIARVAAKALAPEGGNLPLPEGAPYGAVLVDTDACTLCLSCVSLCPSGALVDNEDKPQLRFQEDACLQCGLCANICPEDAITYEPRMNLEDSALQQQVLNEEEPAACVECGALFGVKSAIDNIMEKLAGKHPAFASSEQARMIQMCDNCRIQAQYHSENNPFAGGERPRVRTTADYLSKRKDH